MTSQYTSMAQQGFHRCLRFENYENYPEKSVTTKSQIRFLKVNSIKKWFTDSPMWFSLNSKRVKISSVDFLEFRTFFDLNHEEGFNKKTDNNQSDVRRWDGPTKSIRFGQSRSESIRFGQSRSKSIRFAKLDPLQPLRKPEDGPTFHNNLSGTAARGRRWRNQDDFEVKGKRIRVQLYYSGSCLMWSIHHW